MTTRLNDFFTYNLWANQCLLDACAQLSDSQLDATMRERLAACARPSCTCVLLKRATCGTFT